MEETARPQKLDGLHLEVLDELLQEPTLVSDMIALASRAREHAERLEPHPVAGKLREWAAALELRADEEMHGLDGLVPRLRARRPK